MACNSSMCFFATLIWLGAASTCLPDSAETCSPRLGIQWQEEVQFLLQTTLNKDLRRHRTDENDMPSALRQTPYEWIQVAVLWLNKNGVDNDKLWSKRGALDKIAALDSMPQISAEMLSQGSLDGDFGPYDVASAIIHQLEKDPIVDSDAFAEFQAGGASPSENAVMAGLAHIKNHRPAAFATWEALAFHWHRVMKSEEANINAGSLANGVFLAMSGVDMMQAVQSNMKAVIMATIEQPRAFFGQSDVEWLHTAVNFLDNHLDVEGLWRKVGSKETMTQILGLPTLSQSEMDEAGPTAVAAAALRKIGELSPIGNTVFDYLQQVGKPPDLEKLKTTIPLLRHVDAEAIDLWQFLSYHWQKVIQHEGENRMNPKAIATCTFLSLTDSVYQKDPMKVVQSNIQDVIELTVADPVPFFG